MDRPDNALYFYSYLKKKQVSYGEWFECPTGSEIFNETGLKVWQQQKALKYLTENGYIEKENPIHQQSNNDCPVVHRIVRCLI